MMNRFQEGLDFESYEFFRNCGNIYVGFLFRTRGVQNDWHSLDILIIKELLRLCILNFKSEYSVGSLCPRFDCS